MNNNVHIVGDAQSGVTTLTKEVSRMDTVQTKKIPRTFEDLLNSEDMSPQEKSDFMVSLGRSSKQSLVFGFFGLETKSIIPVFENTYTLPDFYTLGVLACENCANFEVLPSSGRRWANNLRKQGWRRDGADWYCPNCKN